MIALLKKLLADSPSIAAAMKAGEKTEIHAVVIRGCGECPPCLRRIVRAANGHAVAGFDGLGPCLNPRRIESLGVISRHHRSIRARLERLAGLPWAGVRYVWHGREIERPNR